MIVTHEEKNIISFDIWLEPNVNTDNNDKWYNDNRFVVNSNLGAELLKEYILEVCKQDYILLEPEKVESATFDDLDAMLDDSNNHNDAPVEVGKKVIFQKALNEFYFTDNEFITDEFQKMFLENLLEVILQDPIKRYQLGGYLPSELEGREKLTTRSEIINWNKSCEEKYSMIEDSFFSQHKEWFGHIWSSDAERNIVLPLRSEFAARKENMLSENGKFSINELREIFPDLTKGFEQDIASNDLKFEDLLTRKEKTLENNNAVTSYIGWTQNLGLVFVGFSRNA